MRTLRSHFAPLIYLLAVFSLSACGGGGGNDSSSPTADDPTTPTDWDQMKWDQGKWN